MAVRRAACTATRAGRGFTLVEITVVVAIAALLAGVALPSWRDQWLRSHRVDASAALLRVQLAQERYRQGHAGYAERLDQLPGARAGRSESGLYRIELRRLDPESYEASALAEGSQASDTDCPWLRLRVAGAITQRGPDARCWAS